MLMSRSEESTRRCASEGVGGARQGAEKLTSEVQEIAKACLQRFRLSCREADDETKNQFVLGQYQ